PGLHDRGDGPKLGPGVAIDRLVVLGDPDVAEGDARLEWADGGVVRDGAAVARAVEQAIALRFGTPSPMADDEGAQR
ncbi:hypothetical protein ACIKT0_17910, partial [Hansschlegelia beijingensis]